MTYPSEADKAYAAGFFDGEGSINIKKPNGKGGFRLVIGVAQTSDIPLLWLQERWGGSVRLLKRRFTAYGWDLDSRRAGIFLKDVLPFLIVKRNQAEIAIEFQSRKKKRGRYVDPRWAILDAQSREDLLSLRILHKAHS